MGMGTMLLRSDPFPVPTKLQKEKSYPSHMIMYIRYVQVMVFTCILGMVGISCSSHKSYNGAITWFFGRSHVVASHAQSHGGQYYALDEVTGEHAERSDTYTILHCSSP
ncbi:hypothetical protein NEOLEDRAFT_264966 [Neolentinus lepideus HHB14362 ss-1]|uniref:Uncharacterized protein n=1 Tax=Neolentinus lepideus HHB14362 ss-1 TaxID=1314782 RepID=A0A165T2K7_9AGAM|nr:hypothetical protein NEOLEDRAFT_264966 [Neolentinus lepideus HHB14362 ss-1]